MEERPPPRRRGSAGPRRSIGRWRGRSFARRRRRRGTGRRRCAASPSCPCSGTRMSGPSRSRPMPPRRGPLRAAEEERLVPVPAIGLFDLGVEGLLADQDGVGKPVGEVAHRACRWAGCRRRTGWPRSRSCPRPSRRRCTCRRRRRASGRGGRRRRLGQTYIPTAVGPVALAELVLLLDVGQQGEGPAPGLIAPAAGWGRRRPSGRSGGRVVQGVGRERRPGRGGDRLAAVPAAVARERRLWASWYWFRARPICRRLLAHCDAAGRPRGTFWTAGKSRPISMAMMAMTTSSSIRVKARPECPAEGCRNRMTLSRQITGTIEPHDAGCQCPPLRSLLPGGPPGSRHGLPRSARDRPPRSPETP